MKFLEFAIHQKLERNNTLLNYVAKNKPVPCDILESSLESLIAPLADERASALVDDYAHMMQTYIPVTYQKGANDTYTVQGDVPDTILESIALVHGVNANDAISAMIAANEQTLQQHSTITDVELLKSAERLLATPMASIHQDVPVTPSLPPKSETKHTSQNLHSASNDVPDERQLYESMNEVEQGQNEAREQMVQSKIDIDTMYEVPSIADAQTTHKPMEDNTTSLTDTLRDIYRTMIHDIKQAGLDTALGLQL